MTLSLCRAQEYYEAAQQHIRGRYFTWAEFLDSFMDAEGVINYFSFWSGFNFPGDAYQRFCDTFHKDMSSREIRVRDEVFRVIDTSRPFYVIGTLEGADDTIRHELLHALFHVCSEYREGAVRMVDEMDSGARDKISLKLGAMGYDSSVFTDEIQAYCSSGSMAELTLRFGLTEEEETQVCPAFRGWAAKFLEAVRR